MLKASVSVGSLLAGAPVSYAAKQSSWFTTLMLVHSLGWIAFLLLICGQHIPATFLSDEEASGPSKISECLKQFDCSNIIRLHKYSTFMLFISLFYFKYCAAGSNVLPVEPGVGPVVTMSIMRNRGFYCLTIAIYTIIVSLYI